MGNSISQRSDLLSPGLSLCFFNLVIIFVINFSKQETISIPKHSSLVGLAGVFHETISFHSNSEYIVFRPTLTALDILYSAPGELWNWKRPKFIDFQAKCGFSVRNSYIIPISSNEITISEEYTCVVSIKDGCPIMTHSYCDKVIDCHPIPRSMVASTPSVVNHPLVYAAEYPDDSKFEEYLKRCYIYSKIIKQMSNTPMHNLLTQLVFSIWKAFGGNTCDLDSFGEETDKTTDLHQNLLKIMLTERGDGVTSIKRRRHDLRSDDISTLVTPSEHGRPKGTLEDSM
ncbi:hypothetical protein Tco_1384814 [Tanacetum coccineum]